MRLQGTVTRLMDMEGRMNYPTKPGPLTETQHKRAPLAVGKYLFKRNGKRHKIDRIHAAKNFLSQRRIGITLPSLLG